MRRFLLFALVFSLFFAPLVRAVVIQEVYPNSVKDPDGEWIKLYNQENRSIDLSNWTFSDGEYSNNQTINRTIGPEDHLLLVYNASYRNHSEEVLEYGETSSGLKLANGGDEVRLYRKDELIDEVVWEDSEENETLVFHSLEENKTEESDEEEDDDDEEEENETEEERETISSSINITEFTETVKFGGTMEISLKIFKNETRKYALYARVERKSDGWDVSEETKFYLKDRNQSYELTIPIQIKPNCDKRYEEGDYQLVVEGLGVSGSEEVKIEGWKDSVCQERIETKTEVKTVSSCEKKDFELFNYSERTRAGEEMKSMLLIRNDDQAENYTVYSYAYEDNRPLTQGGWFGNKRNVRLDAEEKRALVMENRIKNETDPGNYSYKVRIKNKKDLTRELEILPSKQTSHNRSTSTENRTRKDEGETGKENNTREKENRTSTTGRVFEQKSPVERMIDFLSLDDLF